jgi:hypothetical protein
MITYNPSPFSNKIKFFKHITKLEKFFKETQTEYRVQTFLITGAVFICGYVLTATNLPIINRPLV